ncbi:hypothetical protein FRC03_007263 [Tulasnella sp. 419]|nr:hypothetical protein FRC03_007263 [Tulasnella sp. 419]
MMHLFSTPSAKVGYPGLRRALLVAVQRLTRRQNPQRLLSLDSPPITSIGKIKEDRPRRRSVLGKGDTSGVCGT